MSSSRNLRWKLRWMFNLPHQAPQLPRPSDAGPSSPGGRRVEWRLGRRGENPSPMKCRAVRGMIHLVAEHDRRRLANACIFEVSRLEKEGPAMPFDPIVFARLLKPISRRRFSASVARHDADAYDKNFSSWDHLVALVFAQLSGAGSLRGLEAGWAANGHHHYHLGAGRGGSFARPCQMRPVDARLRFLRTPFQTSPGLRAGRCAG